VEAIMESMKGKRRNRSYKIGCSVPATADALGVTEAKVRAAIQLGQIRTVQIGKQPIVPHAEIVRVKGKAT
jgi:hypothetical protein